MIFEAPEAFLPEPARGAFGSDLERARQLILLLLQDFLQPAFLHLLAVFHQGLVVNVFEVLQVFLALDSLQNFQFFLGSLPLKSFDVVRPVAH